MRTPDEIQQKLEELREIKKNDHTFLVTGMIRALEWVAEERRDLNP